MTDGLRIVHLRIAPQWAILRWAILTVILSSQSSLGKGAEKKNRISYGLFTDKKIYTHFFLEIESMIVKTNFTLGPIEKFIFFVKL